MRTFKKGEMYFVARFGARISQVKIKNNVTAEYDNIQILCETKDGGTITPYAKNLYWSLEDLFKEIKKSVEYFK